MSSWVQPIVTGLLSGAVFSVVIAALFHRRLTEVEEEIKDHFAKEMASFQATLRWKMAALSELLGPVYMHLDRTKRAFQRWKERDLFLEAKIVKESNQTIRDLLLAKPHLIPRKLLPDAGKLIEHYDRWLEEFEQKRSAENPDLKTAFVFVGPQGYPFPSESEAKFRDAFTNLWAELYSPIEKVENI